MTEPTLRVENLRTHFFTRQGVVKAVEDVSFSVGPGKSSAWWANPARANP